MNAQHPVMRGVESMARLPRLNILAFGALLSCGVQAQSGGGGSTGGAAVTVVTTGASSGSAASGESVAGGGVAASGSVAMTGSAAANSGTAASGSASAGVTSGNATSGTANTGSAGSATSGIASTGTGSAFTGNPFSGGTTVGSALSDLTGLPSSAACPPSGGAGAPPSNLAVVINGAQVPSSKAIAFIHFGHSNMAGRGGGPATSRPYFFTQADPHAWMFKGTFQPGLEPTAPDGLNNTPQYPGQTTPTGGPGAALVKLAATLAPSTYFISLGHGVSSAYCSEYLPGALYYDAMMQYVKPLVGKVTFGGIFVMLGITERHGTAGDITGYPKCINSLITQVRKDVGVPDLPLLLTDYEMEATDLPPAGSFGSQIIPYIRMVPSVVCNSALVPTSGLVMLPGMEHHFDLEGHRVWVERALTIMQQKGWFPWN